MVGMALRRVIRIGSGAMQRVVRGTRAHPATFRIENRNPDRQGAEINSRYDSHGSGQPVVIAAHGDFDTLSRERAGLMEQQVNQFLRRLADVIERQTAVPELVASGR